MFWKKKTAFQEIAERWDKQINMQISAEAQSSALALKNAIMITAQSASMIDSNKATKLSEKGAIYFSDMLRGVYLIGYDFSKKYHIEFSALHQLNDFPDEVDEPIKEITQPLVDVALQLIEIAYKPGRIILLNENKEDIKKGLVSRIFAVAGEYFFEGIKREKG